MQWEKKTRWGEQARKDNKISIPGVIWAPHRGAGVIASAPGRKKRGGSSWDGYFMHHNVQWEAFTDMTAKQKYTETWSVACFHATATYLILPLSRWWELHTDSRGRCQKNERTFRMGLDVNPRPLANLARICRMLGFIFHKRVVNKSCYSR